MNCIKMDLALNNLQRLICHKTQTINQQALDYKIEFNICERSVHKYLAIYGKT